MEEFGEDEISFHEMTLEEAEEFIKEMDDLADEATLTDPNIGLYTERTNKEEPLVKELTAEERGKPPGWELPDDDDAPDPTPPT